MLDIDDEWDPLEELVEPTSIHVTMKDNVITQIDPVSREEIAVGSYTLVFNEGFIAFLNGRVYHTTWRYNNVGTEKKPVYESDC